MLRRSQGASGIVRAPGLEHEYAPKTVLPIMRANAMLMPSLQDRFRVEQAVFRQRGG